MQAQIAVLQGQHNAVISSRSFRLANKLALIRSLVRRP